jgi:broad specificity phosphatase PhoE
MPRIYMVRHGRAAAGFGEDRDPGLDDLGRTQAQAAADKLKGIGPRLILSSPLRRCQETSAPLARIWSKTPVIEPAVAEIPSPKGMGLEDRVVWLRKLMAGSWRDVPPDLAQWREACVAAVAALKEDAVVFSHYVAINVLMGSAVADDRVVVFSPENCSVTVFDNAGAKLRLLEKGSEASLTKVN